jgi:hypothetical protein
MVEQQAERETTGDGARRAELHAILGSMKHSGDPHFEYIDIDHLDGEEYLLFDKYIRGTITDSDIATYRAELQARHHAGDNPMRDSHENFLAFIVNHHIERSASRHREM